ncbi:MAG: hypothetical protein KAI15_11270 [Gammaproteobacteria bacterium]|nr:hypothetical protein [Gammaproteobacteria bacterium]
MWIHIKKLVRNTYIVLLMAFTVWYGHFVYPLIFGFEKKEAAIESLMELGEAASLEERLLLKLMVKPEETSLVDLGYRVIDQPYIEGRFHNIGFSIEPDDASICVRCHGTVPHDESKEVRSFLNMHSFYLGCETCHIHPQEGEPPLEFRWYSKATGEPVDNPLKLVKIENLYTKYKDFEKKYVVYGDYGAKISPGELIEGKFEFLKRGNMLNYVEEYLKNEKQFSTVQKSKAKKIIHKNVNKKPRECDGCHNNEQQSLPFAELGYPPRRVEELTETAVVGMIKKYKEFWIPSILTPGKKREK